jgi:hypothetical protein
MPIDFTLVLAGKATAVDTLFERVEQHLLSLGFSRGHEVLVSNGEDEPDSEQEVTLFVEDLAEEKARLHSWHSIYMEFTSPEVSFGLQFDLLAQGSTAGYIFINSRDMYRLHKDSIPAGFYDMISGIAAAAEATGGYGGFEAAQTPAPPEQTLSLLLANPGDRNLWFDIHIVEVSRLASTNAENAWARDFERVERRGFIFFLRREFLAFCNRFG